MGRSQWLFQIPNEVPFCCTCSSWLLSQFHEVSSHSYSCRTCYSLQTHWIITTIPTGPWLSQAHIQMTPNLVCLCKNMLKKKSLARSPQIAPLARERTIMTYLALHGLRRRARPWVHPKSLSNIFCTVKARHTTSHMVVSSCQVSMPHIATSTPPSSHGAS